MTDCIFCKIASGDIPANIVYRDEMITVFMDRGSIRPGHMQVIPNAHHPYFDDLPSDVAAHIMATGQRLAKALKSITGKDRVAFLFTGGDVAHAHAHCLPMHEKTDITSTKYIAETDLTFVAPEPTPDKELKAMAQRIRKELGS